MGITERCQASESIKFNAVLVNYATLRTYFAFSVLLMLEYWGIT